MEGKGWCRAGHGVRESMLLQVILRIHIEPSSVSLEWGGGFWPIASPSPCLWASNSTAGRCRRQGGCKGEVGLGRWVWV